MFKNKLKDKEIEELKEKIISLESKNSEAVEPPITMSVAIN